MGIRITVPYRRDIRMGIDPYDSKAFIKAVQVVERRLRHDAVSADRNDFIGPYALEDMHRVFDAGPHLFLCIDAIGYLILLTGRRSDVDLIERLIPVLRQDMLKQEGPEIIRLQTSAYKIGIEQSYRPHPSAPLRFLFAFLTVFLYYTLISGTKEEAIMLFLWYPRCGTCRKAREWLDAKNLSYTFRDLVQDPPTVPELKEWQKRSALPLKRFFNTSGMNYRALGLKDKLPGMDEEEALKLLASNGMLVKRPLLVTEEIVLIGFRETAWAEALLQGNTDAVADGRRIQKLQP